MPAFLAAVSIAAVGFAVFAGNEKAIYYNPSPSVPRGWYLRIPLQDATPGQLVFVNLPDAAAAMADERRYLPRDVPAIKWIAAGGGDAVCERNGLLRINNQFAARALTQDLTGRSLRPWNGCRVLQPDEIFLLNTSHPASFDSRYYGPVSRAALLGGAIPLWIQDDE